MTEEQLAVENAEEARRTRQVQRIADLTCALLAQPPDLTLGEALMLMSRARLAAHRLFPDKDELFNMLYRPRFLRIIAERFRLPPDKTHPPS